MLPFTVDLMIAGHYEDTKYLAAVGIGATTCNLLCLSFLIGINGAQDTLTSQAFGSKNLVMCGHYLNRGRLITTTFAIPLLIIIYFFGENILLLL